jgi:hypothetical protein
MADKILTKEQVESIRWRFETSIQVAELVRSHEALREVKVGAHLITALLDVIKTAQTALDQNNKISLANTFKDLPK